MFKLPVASPKISSKAKEYVKDCLDKGWLSWRGEYVEKFEEAFAKRTKARYAVMVTNGTTAIHLACLAANLKKYATIVVPNYTFIATGIAPLLLPSVKIKLMDIEPDAWTLDITYLENSKRVYDAIIPVSISGYLWAIQSLNLTATSKGAIIIADMAQGLGVNINIPRAEYGIAQEPGITDYCHMATYSFFANKSLPIGEGGMVTTNSLKYYEELKKHRTLPGFTDEYKYDRFGNNYRPTNIQAAVGLGQLEILDEVLDEKRCVSEKYRQAINRSPVVKWQENFVPRTTPADWMFRLSFTTSSLAGDIRSDLNSLGIETKPLYTPLSQQNAFIQEQNRVEGYLEYFRESDRLHGFYLPTHGDVTDKDIECISEVINRHVSRF